MDEISVIGDGEALIYTKNNCVNCDSTKSLMDQLGVSYTVINMDEKPEAKTAVKRMGFRQAPVVVTSDSRWSGHNEGRIRDLAAGDDIWG